MQQIIVIIALHNFLVIHLAKHVHILILINVCHVKMGMFFIKINVLKIVLQVLF